MYVAAQNINKQDLLQRWDVENSRQRDDKDQRG